MTKKIQILGSLGNKIYAQNEEPIDATDGSLWVDLDEGEASSGGSVNIVVDSALSSTSENPVQNKVVSAAIDKLNNLVGSTKVSDQINAAINKIPAPVTSVNGMTGDVVIEAGASVGRHGAGENAEIFNDYESNEATGAYSHAEGRETEARGTHSHAEGFKSHAFGENAHAENSAIAVGKNSHAEGLSEALAFVRITGSAGATEYSFPSSNAEYFSPNTVISHLGVYAKVVSVSDLTLTVDRTLSESMDLDTQVSVYSGYASGDNSHVEGYNCVASGTNSHAEGGESKALADNAHAEGYLTEASGFTSHAEGYKTNASGPNSHAEGLGTIAAGTASHVQGRYNIEDTEDKYAHIVGNGTDEIPSNAHTLDWDGNAWYAGDIYVGGTSQDDGEKLAKMSDIISVTTAQVGQTIVVKAVDENGRPTEWQAVDIPTDEHINALIDAKLEAIANGTY